MTHLKNTSVILIILASIVTLSTEASQKGSSKAPSKSQPKYVIPTRPPSKPNFVSPGPGERTHPRPPRGKR